MVLLLSSIGLGIRKPQKGYTQSSPENFFRSFAKVAASKGLSVITRAQGTGGTFIVSKN
jgi:hypothetical protein